MEIINVKINGKDYPSYIDGHGVQRFVSNPIVEAFLDSVQELLVQHGWKWIDDHGLYTLHSLSMDYQLGRKGITLEHMIDYFTMIGYSVSGFCDLSYFKDIEIENPLWD